VPPRFRSMKTGEKEGEGDSLRTKRGGEGKLCVPRPLEERIGRTFSFGATGGERKGGNRLISETRGGGGGSSIPQGWGPRSYAGNLSNEDQRGGGKSLSGKKKSRVSRSTEKTLGESVFPRLRGKKKRRVTLHQKTS